MTLSDGGPGDWRLGSASVHRIGLGAMRLTGRIPFGEGTASDRDQGISVLQRAVELGVNHIDTAAFYRSSLHSANALIRDALWPYPSDLVIATKVRASRSSEEPSLRDQVRQNLEELGLERLEVVYLRVLDGVSVGAGFAELAALRDDGRISSLGLSGVTDAQVAEAESIAPVVAVQNRYGIGVRRDEAVLGAATSRGIAFVPFFSVAAEGKHRGPPTQDAPEVVDVARARGVSAAQVRIAWTLQLAPNVLAIPGTSSVEHLEDNLSAGALRLSAEEMTALQRVAPDAAP